MYAAWSEKCTLAVFVEKVYVSGALIMIRGYASNVLAPAVPALISIMEKVAPEHRCIKA
ncbi:hypothetical protein [Methanomethylovorans sp.]|uniref:hypothetical protein n=1 Tax=Methanomethylovorans sp. TaxID=2758717 RepID=UPI00345EDB62